MLEVLSFAAPRKDWTPVEKDAGHFLFAKSQLDLVAGAVVQPPENGDRLSHEAHDRVVRWLDTAEIPRQTLEELQDEQLTLA